jgi:protein MpaA
MTASIRSGSHPERLGRNHGGYHGETIDIGAVLRDDLAAAREHGWQIDELPVSPGVSLQALRRSPVSSSTGSTPARRLYLSTGIHGDEPAGPLAIRQLLQENLWPQNAAIWLCPCLNPTGFPLNRRENAGGFDLNRDYRHLQTPEIRAHVDWLRRQPDLDLTICAHEDWESHGFYLYELNPEDRASYAERMIAAAATACPIDRSEIIEDRPASGGIIRPDLDPAKRPLWPEALFLITHKTRQSYTLEAPSDFPLAHRVAALVAAIRVAFNPTD